MRKVELRMKEQEKFNVIKELVEHNGNKNRASKKLGISIRQINCLIIIYKEKGKSGFVHGNRSRKPASTLDKPISKNIILLKDIFSIPFISLKFYLVLLLLYKSSFTFVTY